MRAFVGQVFLQDVATTLSDQNQFVAHGGSGSVGDCPVQLPARAADVTVAADGLSEARHGDHPFLTIALVSQGHLDNGGSSENIPV